jgi:putative transposase
MIRAHKIRIFPNSAQETALKKACGCARFAWNWALSKWEEIYKAGGKPSALSLKKELNSLKEEQFPWMYESTKCAPDQAIINLGKAYQNFFKGIKAKRKVGKPKLKAKKSSKDSFYLCNTAQRVKSGKLFVPNISGGIGMSEEVRFQGKILSYTVSRDVDRWYVSVIVETEVAELPKTGKTVGVDLGIKTMATMSDGAVIDNHHLLKKRMRKLARKQRELSRKQKGSKNREKARVKVAKIHRTVRLARLDVLHQATTKLVRGYDTIVIEDLNVKGMVKNHKLARAISDCGFGMFRTMLDNKCKMYGKTLVIADRFFPSSKTCSKCGHKKEELKLSERTFACDKCNFEMDRDLNAAINLEKLGACCPEVKPAELASDLGKTQQRAMKQELTVSGCNKPLITRKQYQ